MIKKCKMAIDRLVLCLMCLILFFGVGCSSNKNQGNDFYNPQEGIDIEKPISKLAEGGSSEYKIVIPAEAEAVEEYAASEFQKYVLTSSNANLPIVTDADSPVNGGKFISIGNTSLFKELNIDVSNLNTDGFIIKSEGDTVIIKGQRGRGTLYGVYDFLEKVIGVRFLWQDREVVPVMSTIQMYQMDVTEIPDIALRSYYSSEIMTDLSFAAKMRMIAPRQVLDSSTAVYGGGYGDDIAGDFHSFNMWLPPSQYSSNKEWFSEALVGSGTQPVLSNGLNDDGTINKDVETSVVLEFVKNIKAYLEEHPSVTYVNICQEDNQNYSRNENCLRQYELFGGQSGQMVVFVNAIAKEIDEWLIEKGDDRKMYYNMLAYQYTLSAPVVESTDANGNTIYLPKNELSVPRDNVCIMIAPVEASYNEPLRTEREGSNNAKVYENIKKWAAIAKNFAIFDYNIQFNKILLWFPVLEVIKPNLELYNEIGVKLYVAETAMGSVDTYEKQLIGYLYSKLMWNIDRDINALISEFNALCFGEEAGKIIDDYVSYQGAYYKIKASEDGNYKQATVLGQVDWLTNSSTLNYNHITELERYIQRAENAINNGGYDEDQKVWYLDNLLRVKIQVEYMKYLNYDEVFKTTDTQKHEFMQSFYTDLKKLNITKFGSYDSSTIDSLFGSMGIY